MLLFSQIRSRVFYGWVVVVALLISQFIMVGVNSSFGVFFNSLEDAFGLTRATTSAVLSGRMAFSCIFAFLGGWAIDRYGPRIIFSIMGFLIGLSLILTGLTNATWQLFITYSLLLAMGLGASYVVTTSTTLRWFNRKRGLALGIALSGGGFGTAFLAPLSAFLIDSFQWRGAFMILGGIAWVVVLSVSQLMKKDPHEIGALPDGVTRSSGTDIVDNHVPLTLGLTLLQAFRTRNFWSFLFIWVLMAFNMIFVITHIAPHAIDLGFSSVESSTIISLIGIAMIAGRIITGAITNKIGAKTAAVICSLLQAGVLLWLTWAQELWMLYLFGLLHGFSQGGFGTAVSILVGEAFGLTAIGKILGVLEIGIFIGAAIGPFIGGLIFDINGSYMAAFLIMVTSILARILLVALIKREIRTNLS